MKPGLELDAQIAEKIMGRGPMPLVTKYITGIESQSGSQFMIEELVRAAEELPEYSTSLEATWTVIAKMRLKDKFLNLSNEGGWSARFSGQSDFVPGENAMHAICLAALKAVGSDFD